MGFYDFPLERWVKLRTTNPLAKALTSARSRTDVARWMKRRYRVPHLLFKATLIRSPST